MKIVSTDKVLNVKAMTHDLKIISIMLNRRCRGNETMGRARIKNRVCMCLVYQRVSPSPTLPVSCRFVSFSVRVCACVRSRVRCWSRAYPHRHDGVGAGWSGCRMATYGTKLHAYTETEFSFSLPRSLLCLPLVVVLSVRPTPLWQGWVGVGLR
jgi:hypothetical protein